MITNTKINNWLLEPDTLQVVNQEEIKKYAKEFPYFSLIQHFAEVSGSDAQWQKLSLRFPSHPVLKYILKSKYKKEYPCSFNYILEEEQQQEFIEIQDEPEALIDETSIEDTASTIEELNIEPPQQDYFKLEGFHISDDLPSQWDNLIPASSTIDIVDPKQSLMVVMPFSEWLKYLSRLSVKEKAEEESKKSLRALWQKEKLASALEEETDEIPEEVFEMAVNSIVKKDDIVNESLAEVYVRQEKYQKAIDIYNKLSLLYPEKNTYFASKIEKLKKEL